MLILFRRGMRRFETACGRLINAAKEEFNRLKARFSHLLKWAFFI